MSTVTAAEPVVFPATVPAAEPVAFPYPPTDLLEEDGVPLETDWHRVEMNLLIEVVTYRLLGQLDFFVGGNMFLYFNEEQARNRDFRGPDFFFVKGAKLNPPRPYWAIWKEGGRYPNLIIELSSPSTADEDRTIKKDIYEQIFRTPDYFIYDPFTKKLQGWRLEGQKYLPLKPNDKGWLWCEELQLWLGTWEGVFQGKLNTYLRFFDTEGNLIPTQIERAEAAQQQAEAAQQQAEAAQKRAEAAEAEVARLKALLADSAQKNGE